MNRATRRAIARTGHAPIDVAQQTSLRKAQCLMKIATVLELNKPTTDAQCDGLMLELHSCFDALKNGSSDPELFNRLASSLNTALVLAEAIGQEVVDAMLLAHDALQHCAALRDRHGRYGFTGQGIQDVREALDLYSQIVRLSTPLQINAAVDDGHRRALKQMRDNEVPA